jgi:hypothetical protein
MDSQAAYATLLPAGGWRRTFPVSSPFGDQVMKTSFRLSIPVLVVFAAASAASPRTSIPSWVLTGRKTEKLEIP